MQLIPQVKHLQERDLTFSLGPGTSILGKTDSTLLFIAQEIKDFILKELGFDLTILGRPQDQQIEFRLKDIPGDYQIDIDTKTILIQAKDYQGLFYGLQTLKQVIILKGRHLPGLTIRDQADFGNRGYYHDVTRAKVPTLSQLMKLADLMASFKLNQLQLYVEHTYLYQGQSEVWTKTDPLTAEEILLLDDYCSKRYIELVPSISTFGHLYELLQSQSFSHLSEIDTCQGFSFVDRMNHHTLDISNDQSIQVVKEMIDDFIPLFRSKQFNICADETFDLGEGKNQQLAKELGKSKLYVDFLLQIINHVKGHQKEIMFWGDIIIKYPDHIKDLPQDLICLNWWYWLNYPEDKVRLIAENGFRQYMCPGVNGWNTLMNNHRMAYDNNKLMVDYGKRYQALGILNTDWGDYGHWNPLSTSVPGLIYGAAFSWGETRSYQDLNQAIDQVYFHQEGLMEVLDRISQNHFFTLLPLVQYMEKGLTPYLERIALTDQAIEDSQVQIRADLDRLLDYMVTARPACRYHLAWFHQMTQGIELFNDLYPLIANRAFNKNHQVRRSPSALAQDLEYWFYDYKKLWLKDNKPSELYRLKDFIQTTCQWLRTY